MNSNLVRAVALLIACAAANEASAQAPSGCAIQVYPAEGIHSVGEDFDAIHGVDQDLRDYYQNAGRSLNWLTPARQISLLDKMPIGELVGFPLATTTIHTDPLSRHQAVNADPPQSQSSCVIAIMLPQIMLERGGLAVRSLRVFGIVRRYENGSLLSGYSGYAAARMSGFQLKSPADAEAATKTVEHAYVSAVEQLLRNSSRDKATNTREGQDS